MKFKKLGMLAATAAAMVLAAGCATHSKKPVEKPQTVKQDNTAKAPKHFKGGYHGKKHMR